MIAKTVFLLLVFRAASSELLHRRRCDPEQRQEKPTLCSNYENIQQIDNVQTKLAERQAALQRRIEDVEGNTEQLLKATSRNISTFEGLVANLSKALKDFETAKLQAELEFREAKTQLEEHNMDIVRLKRDIGELVKDVAGNFSQIEQRFDATEKQSREKTAKLEHLETKTEAAFVDVRKQLDLYGDELSNLNLTVQALENEVKARLDARDAQLKEMGNNSEAFSARLNDQVDEFKGETDRRFRKVDELLKTQNTRAERQEVDMDSLKNESAEIKHRLRSVQEQRDRSKLELNSLKAEVDAKVAFSATVTESRGADAAPNASGVLVFDRVFTNVGNSYNRETGVFTAPLNGLYHFSISTFGFSGHTSGAILLKNGRFQVSTWESTGPDASDTASNTVILDLNAGDAIHVILWEGGEVHTGVFSGFLVFTS